MAPTKRDLTAGGDDPEAAGDAQSDADQIAAGPLGLYESPSASGLVRSDRKLSVWKWHELEFCQHIESPVIHGTKSAGSTPNVLAVAAA
jgi:hypothetical protein